MTVIVILAHRNRVFNYYKTVLQTINSHEKKIRKK